mgnify:CR=1 FL=1
MHQEKNPIYLMKRLMKQKENNLIDNNFENIIPYVVERDPRGERTYDIYSLLLKERIIFLGTGINDQVANAIIAQLLFLDREDPERDINLYINSPGGVITAGLAIYDTMQLIRPNVSTICVGMAASMGTVLLCGGAGPGGLGDSGIQPVAVRDQRQGRPGRARESRLY